MFEDTSLVSILLTAPLAYGIYRLGKLAYWEYTSTLRDLPGPPSAHWVLGNMPEIVKADTAKQHEAWEREYGSVFKYHFLLGMQRLYTNDLKALNHIIGQSYIYHKPALARTSLEALLGPGVLTVEGDVHRNQRRIMNPAFGPAQIRDLTGIYVEKSIQLRDIWADQITKAADSARIDVLEGLSKMTLDVIGLAGFNYEFDALNLDKPPNELNQVFSYLFRADEGFPILNFIQFAVPFMRWIPTLRQRETKRARGIMDRIAQQLLDESKAAVLEEGLESKSGRKDLLSLLVKSNMAPGLSDSQRLSDRDVLAQVPTFFTAGHETTSTGTTWALFALSQNIRVQNKLREELHSISTDNPTMEELNSLPYLDMVVREALRIHAPVASTVREAVKDDIIPLNKPYVDAKGITHDRIHVRKGQTIFVPILAINRSKELWGEDAEEFNPERWENLPEAVSKIPGVWGNMLTFLGGPHACIGYRFTIVEMKALLFTLIRAFTFELAVPVDHITRRSTAVTRPMVKTEKNKNQMPMIVKPYILD